MTIKDHLSNNQHDASLSTFKKQTTFNATPNHQHKKTLSQISGLHSHRNLKSSHQMLLAESMYDPKIKVSYSSRFSLSFEECLNDNTIMLYFVQFMESLGETAKNLIKCFLQTNCLMISIKQNHQSVNFEDIESNSISLNDDIRILNAQLISDFNRLYSQFIHRSSYASVHIDDNLYQEIYDFFDNPAYFKCESLLILNLFCCFWKYLFDKIEIEYYELFLRSNFFLKYEVDVLESNTADLSDILNSNSAIVSVFLEFMNIEKMKAYVDYLLMYKNFKSYSRHYSDAVALYDRFFNISNKSSSSFLDFSDSILDELRNSIQEDHYSSDCFDKISSILIQYFSKTYLPQFFQSNIYSEYLQNCHIKLKSDNVLSKPQKPSNEAQYKKLIKQDSNLSSQSSDFTDSDSLWKRDLKGQLQFTYIDKYGRMSSLLEPEPNKAPSNSEKLSQVIKKFTFNTSEDKEKEDNAWKIAESIINDVCSVTIDQPNMKK